MVWPFSVFLLASFSCPFVQSTCAIMSGGQLTGGPGSRDVMSPVYSRQNELRSRWVKYGMFCRSNCTRYRQTSLMAVAAWTPTCLVGSARRWLVIWSMAAVLVPSRIRSAALGSVNVWLVPCCGRRQLSSYRAATTAQCSGRCRRLSDTTRYACHVPGAACLRFF